MKTGMLLALIPNSGVIFAILGIFIIIFGAILIQLFVEGSNRKSLTFLIPTIIVISYFFVVSPELTVFYLASATFLSVQGMYYARRKTAEA